MSHSFILKESKKAYRSLFITVPTRVSRGLWWRMKDAKKQQHQRHQPEGSRRMMLSQVCRRHALHIGSLLLLLIALLQSPANALNLSPFTSKKTPVVDQWRILGDGKLTGVVNGHPVIQDGDKITTSPLSNPDFCKSGATVTTLSGSTYKLKQPQEAYLKSLKQKNQKAKQQAPQQRRRGTQAVTKNMDMRVVSDTTASKTKKSGSGGGNNVVLGVSLC